MSCGGGFSSLMSIAGAGILPGVDIAALGINTDLVSNLTDFGGLDITSTFSEVVTGATDLLGSGTLESLRTLGADIMPALTNAIPTDFTSVLGSVSDGGLSGFINSQASNIMGGGDLGKFGQVVNASQGFLSQNNGLLNTVVNGTDSISKAVFSGMDNVITGSLSQVSQAAGVFGGDLKNLGSLIDLNNIQNLGNPSALLQQVARVGGAIPAVTNALKQAGLPTSVIASLTSAQGINVTGTLNKIAYDAMAKVTGPALSQVKAVLGVKTGNIGNMADLLDPKKILPNSFMTLTAPTTNGLRGIYSSATGSVNASLATTLPETVLTGYNGTPNTG